MDRDNKTMCSGSSERLIVLKEHYENGNVSDLTMLVGVAKAHPSNNNAVGVLAGTRNESQTH